MTLAMTLVAPWGICQSSDCRNTKTGHPPGLVDDWSPKCLSLHAQDGVALISYTGIGAFTDGAKRVIMSDWVNDTLRSAGATLADSYERIRGEATTLFQEFARTATPTAHIFSIGAFVGEDPCYVEIHNIAGCDPNGTPHASSEFVISGGRLEKPDVFFRGSGSKAVREEDQQLLRAHLRAEPERPEDLMAIFAEVNKRASESVFHGWAISAACHTAWKPPQGRNRGGGKQQYFGWGQQAPPEMELLRVNLFGLNMTERLRDIQPMGPPRGFGLDTSGRLVRQTDAGKPST